MALKFLLLSNLMVLKPVEDQLALGHDFLLVIRSNYVVELKNNFQKFARESGSFTKFSGALSATIYKMERKIEIYGTNFSCSNPFHMSEFPSDIFQMKKLFKFCKRKSIGLDSDVVQLL